MITRRDSLVINFIYEFKVAKTSTLAELFYSSYAVARRRLTKLVEYGGLKRERDGWSEEYYYFVKKPKQLRRAILLTDFYRELHKIATIEDFYPKRSIGNILPDGVVYFNHHGESHIAMIEIEISHNGFNGEKFNQFDWTQFFPREPEVVIISDHRYKCERFKTFLINTELDLSPLS